MFESIWSFVKSAAKSAWAFVKSLVVNTTRNVVSTAKSIYFKIGAAWSCLFGLGLFAGYLFAGVFAGATLFQLWCLAWAFIGIYFGIYVLNVVIISAMIALFQSLAEIFVPSFSACEFVEA